MTILNKILGVEELKKKDIQELKKVDELKDMDLDEYIGLPYTRLEFDVFKEKNINLKDLLK